MRGARTFPFVPKSSQGLEPGDFWSIPLQEGGFGCGRVLEHMPKGMPGARVGFLAALLDWRGETPPSAAGIAGAKALEQGLLHILGITQTGGAVLGNRPLSLDALEAWVFVNGNVVQRGFTPLRPWRRGDAQALPSLSWWGYDVIQILANKHLGPRGGAKPSRAD
jgi:hypothetical protein